MPDKFTAEQVGKHCPESLRQIGEKIKREIEAAKGEQSEAKGRYERINKLLSDAGKLCDKGGFTRFCELFCPDLKKSQAYAWLALAVGKKTYEQHLADQRERQRKSREQKKKNEEEAAKAAEDAKAKSEAEAEAARAAEEAKAEARAKAARALVASTEKDAANDHDERDHGGAGDADNRDEPKETEGVEFRDSHGKIDDPPIVAPPLAHGGPEGAPAAHLAEGSAPDGPLNEANHHDPQRRDLIGFSVPVMELIRITDHREPGYFAGTSVAAENLSKLGAFLIAVAGLKKRGPEQNAGTPETMHHEEGEPAPA